MKTFDEIREMLAEKIKKEKARLKSYSARANHHDLANAIARHVEALMCSSRNSELKKLVKKRPKLGSDSYIKERLKATSRMADAIQHEADRSDSKRPWRPTGQVKDKHDKRRSSKSSRHH